MALPAKDVLQAAYAVKSLEKACRYFVDQHGVGPFFISEFHDFDILYRGQPAKISLRLAQGYRGCVQYELFETDFPLYEDVRGAREIAFHHTMMATETYDSDLARFIAMGCPPIIEQESIKSCYVDTLAKLGHYVELFNYNCVKDQYPQIFEVDAYMMDASRNWDGKKPLRSGGHGHLWA